MEAATKFNGQVVAYIRVSSADQNTARQEEAIAAINPDEKFVDHCSGKDTNRPALQRCLKYVRKGDILVVHSIDRLCRNLEDLLRIVRELGERGIAIRFLKEGIDTSANNSIFAEFMLQIIGAVAGFERAMIEERRREGIAIAKAKGVYKGRKPVLNAEQKAEIRARRANGVTVTRLAADYKVCRDVIYDALKETPAA